ncbi:hypothetical protein XBJ2_730008 [Xenorhabdus bovienii str. Jollieti]|nr:hypothetical protein XBJ2_730008 [Xenorhabdus bovienii str. Jollieti]
MWSGLLLSAAMAKLVPAYYADVIGPCGAGGFADTGEKNVGGTDSPECIGIA